MCLEAQHRATVNVEQQACAVAAGLVLPRVRRARGTGTTTCCDNRSRHWMELDKFETGVERIQEALSMPNPSSSMRDSPGM